MTVTIIFVGDPCGCTISSLTMVSNPASLQDPREAFVIQFSAISEVQNSLHWPFAAA